MLTNFLETMGYTQVCIVNGQVCGLMRMIFTAGLFIDMDEVGPSGGRICFDTYADASLFLKEWDGITDPVIGIDGCTADKRKHMI
jgi:hypothetical protein